jgi:hypothetical protein
MDKRRHQNVTQWICNHSIQDGRVQDHHRARNTRHPDTHHGKQLTPGQVVQVRLDHKRGFDYAEKNG